MQTLYLNVKHEVRIDPYAVMLLNKLSKLFLLLIFDTVELVNCFVIDLAFQTLEVIKVSDPLLADEVGDELRQLGVAKTQPAALCYAVCLVLETLGIQLIPLFESVVLEDLCMDRRNTVDVA